MGRMAAASTQVVTTPTARAQVLGSYANLMFGVRAITMEPQRARDFGALMLTYMKAFARRYIESYRQIGDAARERVHHVRYSDFVSAPVDTACKLLRDTGAECGGEDGGAGRQTRAALEAWHADNKQHKHGAVSYSLEAFGLAREDVRRKLDFLFEFEAEMVA